jgi:Domain of unknown function (DUF4129)
MVTAAVRLLAASAGSPLIHGGPARQLARHELARSMYRPSWWERVTRALDRWLDAHLGSLGPQHLGWWTLIALIIVAVLIAGGMLAWIRLPRRSRRRRDRAVLGDRRLSAADHRRAAERLAGADDFAGAIVERMRALAVDLEARGILAPRPGRTASELAVEAATALARAAEGQPDLAGRLQHAARLFDDVRYGGRPGDRAGYAHVRDLDASIAALRVPQAAVAGGGPGAAAAMAGAPGRGPGPA